MLERSLRGSQNAKKSKRQQKSKKTVAWNLRGSAGGGGGGFPGLQEFQPMLNFRSYECVTHSFLLLYSFSGPRAEGIPASLVCMCCCYFPACFLVDFHVHFLDVEVMFMYVYSMFIHFVGAYFV